jgi:TetR/AcrR family transcriptional regulator
VNAVNFRRRKKNNSRAADAEQSRNAILEAAKRLMIREGYAAVSTRRVAAEAGVKPPLVHYYYKTTDDLFIALYRKVMDETLSNVTQAVASDKPLDALWKMNMDTPAAILAVELLALANHRPAIRAEIKLRGESLRSMQAGALARVLRDVPIGSTINLPLATTVFLTGLSMVLAMEGALGTSTGHKDACALVDWLIHWLEGMDGQPQSAKGSAAAALAAGAAARESARGQKQRKSKRSDR